MSEERDDGSYSVAIDDQLHVIEGKRLTLVCHKDDMNVKILDQDVMEINPEMTLSMAAELTHEQWQFLRQQPVFREKFGLVFKGIEPPDNLHSASMGIKHVTGMIILIAQAIGTGKRPFLRLPESFLHPVRADRAG